MHSQAHVLRENTSASGLMHAARMAVAKLAQHDVPHLVIGGLAVQEHGYPRLTLDVNLVVPDVPAAVEWLTDDLASVFRRDPKVAGRIMHLATGVVIDLVPAGGVSKHGSLVPVPALGKATSQLQIIALEELISLKLDSAANSPHRRPQDKNDVVELITRRHLPRDLPVAEPIRQAFQDLWDDLNTDPN